MFLCFFVYYLCVLHVKSVVVARLWFFMDILDFLVILQII